MGILRPLALCFVIAACGGAGGVQTQEMSGGSPVVAETAPAGSSAAAANGAAANGAAANGPARAGRPAANGGGGAAAAASGVAAGSGAATQSAVAGSVASAGACANASPGVPGASGACAGASAAGASASPIAGATAGTAASAGASAGTSAAAGAGSPASGNNFSDSFDGDGPLMGYTTNNASAIPDVSRVSGRYTAKLQSNADDITLHYNQSQGRIDARKLSFPFEVIARNIGIGSTSDPQMAAGGGVLFNLAGIQVHVLEFESRNSAHIVVGHSGTANFSIEGKSTVNGTSVWDNEGSNANPLGRADLRVVGNADKTLSVYWQAPNADPAAKKDEWKPYKGTGKLSGPAPMFGQEVYVGLITYAVGEAGVPFVGTCDSFEGREP